MQRQSLKLTLGSLGGLPMHGRVLSKLLQACSELVRVEGRLEDFRITVGAVGARGRDDGKMRLSILGHVFAPAAGDLPRVARTASVDARSATRETGAAGA